MTIFGGDIWAWHHAGAGGSGTLKTTNSKSSFPKQLGWTPPLRLKSKVIISVVFSLSHKLISVENLQNVSFPDFKYSKNRALSRGGPDWVHSIGPFPVSLSDNRLEAFRLPACHSSVVSTISSYQIERINYQICEGT